MKEDAEFNSCSSNFGMDSRDDLGENDEHPSALQRICLDCEAPITEGRLKAIPTASRCTVCTERAGDVPRLKRYDEFIGEEKISIYYKTPNQYLRYAIHRDREGLFNIPPDVDEQPDQVSLIAATPDKYMVPMKGGDPLNLAFIKKPEEKTTLEEAA